MTEFTELTPLAAARERLLDLVDPVARTETVPLEAADGRVAAETVTAERAIPHYERVAMDGYALRAGDTTSASSRTPVRFEVGDRVEHDTAVAVDTGEVVPEGADAVLPIEDTQSVDDGRLVVDSVPPGANVAPVGEDVAVGDSVVDAGERLTPAHLGLLRGVGVEEVPVYERPEIALLPTGEELVPSDPAPGEIVETNSLVVGRYVERWNGTARRREPTIDDTNALCDSLEGNTDADVVVTMGGTSVGERDVVPATVDAIGEMLVHGVGFRPGHPVGIGVIDGTPVLTLPGYPVGCLVAANLLLRPALATAGHLSPRAPPTTVATLERKIASDLGTRTYARVALDEADTVDDRMPTDTDAGDGTSTATPIRARGSGVLSSVSEADGWVVVAESSEGIPAGETVAVEHWEAQL